MKPKYEEFHCPQCGQIRYIYVDGICSSCNTENELEQIIRERKNMLLAI